MLPSSTKEHLDPAGGGCKDHGGLDTREGATALRVFGK